MDDAPKSKLSRSTRMRLLIALVAFLAITALAFLFADEITTNETIQRFVGTGGIFGAIVVAFISGLNFIVPVPPATFAPAFIEAGVSTWLVVAGFVIGTTLADSISYVLGWVGRSYAETTYPALTKRLHEFMETHARLVLPASFLYFTLAPLPNEIILVPLALSGYRYRTLILPMIAGTIIHHTALVLGYRGVFEWLF